MVIDSTDRERLMTIKQELYSMLAHEVGPEELFLLGFKLDGELGLSPNASDGSRCSQDLAQARVLILANKQDLKVCVSLSRCPHRPYRCVVPSSLFCTLALVLAFAYTHDRQEAMSAAEISKQFNLTTIKNHSWHIQGCCALTGEGLYEGMEWLTESINQRH